MTRPLDFAGCETTLPSGPAIGSWDATQRAFLAHAAATPDHLATTLRLAPDFALAHAAKGLFCLMLGKAELVATARDCLRSARQAVARTAPTARETAYVEALADWLAGRASAAAHRLDALLEHHPQDALAMKLVQAIAFMLGRPGLMRRSVDRLAPLWRGHPAEGYLHGCRAFTLEESGEYAAAIRAGERALALAPDDAWGLHAVAHVHDMTGNARAGLDWLAGRERAWAHCNNFRFHVWWHVALMHLDLGETEAALALYDAEVRAERTDDYRDIANAASLLVRLELDGVPVGGRWQELADLAESRTADGCVVFADLHYLLALIGGGRQAAIATLIARMTSRAGQPESEMDHVTRHPGLPAAEGLAAFGEGRYARAFARLGAARAALPRIGGSHAQRDVFERLAIEAGLRAGRFDAVRRMLDERSTSRGAEDGYAARRRALIARVAERGTDAA